MEYRVCVYKDNLNVQSQVIKAIDHWTPWVAVVVTRAHYIWRQKWDRITTKISWSSGQTFLFGVVSVLWTAVVWWSSKAARRDILTCSGILVTTKYFMW